MKFLSFLCTKWMENCEAMTSSTHSWSRNVSWKFAKLQSVITSLFFNRLSSGFHCFVQFFYTLSSEIKLNHFRTSPLMHDRSFIIVTQLLHVSLWTFQLTLVCQWGPNVYAYMQFIIKVLIFKHIKVKHIIFTHTVVLIFYSYGEFPVQRSRWKFDATPGW